MNLVKLLVPVGRQYQILCPEQPEQARAGLLRMVVGPEEGTSPSSSSPAKSEAEERSTTDSSSQKQATASQPAVRVSLADRSKSAAKIAEAIASTNSDLDFDVSARGAAGLFQPRLRGKIKAGGREIRLTAAVNPLIVGILNIPANLSIGAIFGALAAGYLVPDVSSLIGLAITTLALPLLLAIAGIFLLKWIVESNLPVLVDAVSKATGVPPQAVAIAADDDTWVKAIFTEQTIATAIAAILTVGAAFYMHQYAWDLWVEGDYQKSEALCRPVQTLATAVFGFNSAVASDCNYYIAECLRCQGKNSEAEEYYKKAIDSLGRRLGEGNSKVVDGIFNLARVYEAEGKNKEAEETYKKSIDLYERVPDIGPRGGWLARVLDRQGMFYWKLGRYAEAEAAAKRASEIDKRWGENADYPDYAEALNDLGVIYYRQGRLKLAEETLNHALDLKNKCDSRVAQAVSEYNLSLVYRAIKDNSRANKLAESARQAFKTFLGDGKEYPSDEDLYSAVLRRTRQDYETPHWETRSEQLGSGPGRI